MKLTPSQFETIHTAIERARGNGDSSQVDITDLSEALGVQWSMAKKMLYHASKQMGFSPTRAGKVSGEGAMPKTKGQKSIERMLAAVSDLMAGYDAGGKLHGSQEQDSTP